MLSLLPLVSYYAIIMNTYTVDNTVIDKDTDSDGNVSSLRLIAECSLPVGVPVDRHICIDNIHILIKNRTLTLVIPIISDTLKYFFKDEETEEEQTQEFSYGDEETEEEQAQESAVLADEIKDIFHQNSYGMMNIENNYMEAMLSETFRYKDIDKNMRLSVRVKDAFIKYNRDKWLEKFNDVNTEWINECICLGEFFENIMKEMSAYLEQICEKEDIIAWSRNVVEECKKEDDINKLSEHLYGIWNSVYNYAIENKIAITKVRNEYFEKYFSSLKNEKRQEELL